MALEVPARARPEGPRHSHSTLQRASYARLIGCVASPSFFFCRFHRLEPPRATATRQVRVSGVGHGEFSSDAMPWALGRLLGGA